MFTEILDVVKTVSSSLTFVTVIIAIINYKKDKNNPDLNNVKHIVLFILFI